MPQTLRELFEQRLPARKSDDPQYVSELVEAVLDAARRSGSSDVHLVPGDAGLAMSWRIDGVLQPVTRFPRELSPNVVARLKVLAELLTYRTDVPQEGRIRGGDQDLEMRVSTFPTLHGEKAVVRLFVGSGKYRVIDDLGLPGDIAATLRRLLHETGGAILVTGPAGSGKTTTLYACLRELAGGTGVSGAQSEPGTPPGGFPADHAHKSLVTLEDPIEAVLDGVAQSQVRPAAGLDYETGLRSLMRQDPDVVMVGEIRDRSTAEIVFQASLTGHLVLTSFHAGSSAEAVGRLLDMGIEPYQLRSGLLAIVNQRLVRRLCECAAANDDPAARLALEVERVREPVGCNACGGTGYRERMVLAEILLPNTDTTGRAILSQSEAHEIERLAVKAGMIPARRRACEAVNAGQTSPAEVRRVFGFR